MDQINLSDEDLLKIFSYKKEHEQKRLAIIGWINRISLGLTICAVSYIVINLPAFRDKAFYWYRTDVQAVQIATPDVSAKTILRTPDKPTDVPESVLPTMTENTIKMPALSITAPISWRVPNTAKDVSVGLETGVIQVDGSALPGEKGNVYVTGHSSNYIWAKGNYNSIFAILSNLLIGDYIYLQYNNQTYEYKVKSQKVVAATDLSVLERGDKSGLSIVTCWPVGTALKRLVVMADQTYPNPANNVVPTNINQFQKLPSAR